MKKPTFLHELPPVLIDFFSTNPELEQKRNSLTPLAQNERICRLTIPKQQETRDKHLKRLVEDIGNGKKRPCCWPGCPHRRESAKKWFNGMKE